LPDLIQPHFTDTNGTAEPGTIVVGSTPFQRSDPVRIGPSAFGRASMAAASASPVILMLETLASPFNRVASASASAQTALALAWAPRPRAERLLLLEKLGNR